MRERERVDCLFEKWGSEAPPGLEDAARHALEVRRVLRAFRGVCLKIVERGLLYHFMRDVMQTIAVVSGQIKVRDMNTNPYAVYKLQNPGFSQYEQLDFLLEEVPSGPGPLTIDLPFDGTPELKDALRDAALYGELAELVVGNKYLSDEENLDLAVLHARLWLLRSPIPVRVGVSTSYADMRDKDEAPKPDVPRQDFHLCYDELPSVFHVALCERTLMAHSTLMEEEDPDLMHLCHFAPSDFAPYEDSYWGHHARVRYPHTRENWVSAGDLVASLARCGKDEEDLLGDLDNWKALEAESMYILLAEYIHGMTPSMHQELKAKQDRGNLLEPVAIKVL